MYRLSCKGEPSVSLPRKDEASWLEEHISGAYQTDPEAIALP